MLYHTEFSSRLFGFKVVLVYKSQFGSAIKVSLGKNRVDRLNVCVAVDYLQVLVNAITVSLGKTKVDRHNVCALP